MTTCQVHASGAIELYFYDELAAAERQAVDDHLQSCGHCRSALADLAMIRIALAERPDISSPPSGDWSGFMSRLDASIANDRASRSGAAPVSPNVSRSMYLSYLAVAALLALVTFTAVIAFRSRTVPAGDDTAPPAERVAAAPTTTDTAAFEASSEEHFERSKLVVLGIATKDPQAGSPVDWTYERSLASSLLNDTRIYRLAAEDRGLTALAGVMRDLELVLLQTSLIDDKDPASLPQLQRLIRKRDLLEKMDVVATTGL